MSAHDDQRQVFRSNRPSSIGEGWKRPLAALLGMTDRTVFRIAAAARDATNYPVDADFGPIMAEHLAERAAEAETQPKEAWRLSNCWLNEDYVPPVYPRHHELFSRRLSR